MPELDYRYHIAASCAAAVVNRLDGHEGGCKAELFGRVTYAILAAIYEAEALKIEMKLEPSNN